MKRRRRLGLQNEIARLLADYPRDEWLKLADMLRDAAFVNALAHIANTLAGAAPTAKPQRVGSHRSPPPEGRQGDFLSSLAQGDEPKLALLRKIKKGLDDKTIFHSMSELRYFAEVASIKEQLPAKRETAIREILRHLAQRQHDELEKILEIRSSSRNQGEEYREWVKLILGR